MTSIPITILYERPASAKILEFLAEHSEVVYIQGSPLKLRSLIRAGVDRCAKLLVISGSGSSGGHTETIMMDQDAILLQSIFESQCGLWSHMPTVICELQVPANIKQLSENVLSKTSSSSSPQEDNIRESFSSKVNPRFASSTPPPSLSLLLPPLASPSPPFPLISLALLLLLTDYGAGHAHAPPLCFGLDCPSCGIQLAVCSSLLHARGIGSPQVDEQGAPESVFIDSVEGERAVPARRRADVLVKIPANQEIIGKSFAEVFSEMTKIDAIPIGIYRRINPKKGNLVSETSHCHRLLSDRQFTTQLPIVYTCPNPSAIVESGDCVYIMASIKWLITRSASSRQLTVHRCKTHQLYTEGIFDTPREAGEKEETSFIPRLSQINEASDGEGREGLQVNQYGLGMLTWQTSSHSPAASPSTCKASTDVCASTGNAL
eukprot:760149-Hanusia_phi.AAC.2